MKKISILLVLVLALNSCFWSKTETSQETDTGAIQTPDDAGTQPVTPEVKASDLKIESSASTTTIIPKTSSGTVTGSGDVSSTETDLNAAKEEVIVKEFEAEIDDLLKLLGDTK